MPRRKIKGAKSDRDLRILSNMTVARMTFGAESDKSALLRKLRSRRKKLLK